MPTKTQQLKELPDNYIECRYYVYHAFTTIGAFWTEAFGYPFRCVVSECNRGCGVIREDLLYSNGKRRLSRYHRPDDYLLDGTGPKPKMERIRQEFLSRIEVYEDRDAIPVKKAKLKLVKSA